jgi:hypothetical protein
MFTRKFKRMRARLDSLDLKSKFSKISTPLKYIEPIKIKMTSKKKREYLSQQSRNGSFFSKK